jgi:hypothetical protein
MGFKRMALWVIALIAVVPALAGDFADSTGTVRARRALVLPDSVTEERVGIIATNVTNQFFDQGVPAGYVEYTINAGPHAGATPSYPNVTYGYVQASGQDCNDEACWTVALDANLCGGDLSHRVLELHAAGWNGGAVLGHYTCEPIGKVTGLIKANMATISTISQTQVNSYALSGTIGVNTSGVEPICKALGFTSYVPGTVAYWYKGSGCPGGYVTQYRSGAWVSDTACYNQILTGMQCYR